MLKRSRVLLISFLMLSMILGGAFGFAHFSAPHAAYAEIVGNPQGATDSLEFAPASGKGVKRIVYFGGTGNITPVVTSTPLVSDPVCGLGGYTLYSAQAVLTGTMTGTAPTLAIKWRHSIDGGTNWVDVGSWTTINATVTPASQVQTVSDVYNNTTAVAYGDCWDALMQFGGTGAVGAHVTIKGIAK